MSRLYFHSPSGEAKLSGSEHVHLGMLCADLTVGLLSLDSRHEQLLDVLAPERREKCPQWPGPDYYRAFRMWVGDIETQLRVAWREGPFQWRGHSIESLALMLNTAILAGSDAMILAARLYGQAEIHCYCEGVDRAWLAGLIRQGLDERIFRSQLPGQHPDGWEPVIRFLLDRDDEPVVVSHSVTDGFPDRAVAGWGLSEEAAESWYALPGERQWELAMAGLRASHEGTMRLDPAHWRGFLFAHELSVMDLLAPDRDERLDKALGVSDGDHEVAAH